MADDRGAARRCRRMDLNLYLAPPLSPRPQSHHLGFDLALTSLSTMPPPPDDPVPPHPAPEPAANIGTYIPIPAPVADFSSSSSQQQALPDPGLFLPRLIEPSRRRMLRGFRPSRDGHERSVSSSQLMRDIMSSQRALDAARKHRDIAEGIAEEEAEEDKQIFAANFECNICLDLSKDPVVTSCGHLFCWPCLYQWLHLYSDHTECPVCKGHLDEAKIVPIYGRGGAEATVKVGYEDDLETGLKIPPRPHGHRVDSLRQQLQRPVSRRSGEGNYMLWSRVLDDENANLQTLLDGARSMVISRLREWRTQREEGNNESGVVNIEGTELLTDNNTSGPQIITTSSLRLEADHWHRSPLHSFGSTHSTAPGGFGSGNSQAGTSTSSVNNRHHEPQLNGPPSETMLASDQASASSSMAEVQGDVAAHDTAREPYAAGSSRTPSKRRKE